MLATIHGAIESTLLGTTILGFGTSNGNINDYFYEFRVRADTPELLPHFKSASEDRERSVRYLAKDEYEGSLSLRKADEREGQRMIEAAFPPLVRKQVQTSSAHGAYNGRRLQTYELLQVDCIAWVANRPAAKDAWCR